MKSLSPVWDDAKFAKMKTIKAKTDTANWEDMIYEAIMHYGRCHYSQRSA